MNMLRILPLLCCFLAFASCAPTPGIPTQSVYTFQNGTGQKITLDLYENKADYDSGVNRLSTIFLKPATEGNLTMQVGHTYYLDWYSDDYSVNNWGSSISGDDPFPAAPIKVAAVNDHIRISEGRIDLARKVLLGDGMQSTWRVLVTDDAFLNGTHDFVFRKNLSASHTFTNNAGIKTTTEYVFEPDSRAQYFQLTLTGNSARIVFEYQNNNAATAGTSADSLRTYFEHSTSYFYFTHRL